MVPLVKELACNKPGMRRIQFFASREDKIGMKMYVAEDFADNNLTTLTRIPTPHDEIESDHEVQAQLHRQATPPHVRSVDNEPARVPLVDNELSRVPPVDSEPARVPPVDHHPSRVPSVDNELPLSSTRRLALADRNEEHPYARSFPLGYVRRGDNDLDVLNTSVRRAANFPSRQFSRPFSIDGVEDVAPEETDDVDVDDYLSTPRIDEEEMEEEDVLHSNNSSIPYTPYGVFSTNDAPVDDHREPPHVNDHLEPPHVEKKTVSVRRKSLPAKSGARSGSGFHVPGPAKQPSRASGYGTASTPAARVQKSSTTKSGVKPAPLTGRVSDASLLKRNLTRAGEETMTKRSLGANDPENIQIVNLYDNENLAWVKITEIMNAQRVATGRAPNFTPNSVHNRYNRNAPLLYAAEGRRFVPIKQRTTEMVADTMWTPELDTLLVKIVKEVDAQKWKLVSDRFTAETTIDVDGAACAHRFSLI